MLAVWLFAALMASLVSANSGAGIVLGKTKFVIAVEAGDKGQPDATNEGYIHLMTAL